jgi:hypothetical protein
MSLSFLSAPIAHWPLDRLRPCARKAFTQSSLSARLPGGKGLLRETYRTRAVRPWRGMD